MDRVAERAGLAVNYTCESGWPEIVNKIEKGEADITGMTSSEERRKSLIFTTMPFEAYNTSFFTRAQSTIDANRIPHGYSVGTVRGGAVLDRYKDRSDTRFVVFDNYQQGLFSLLAGEIDLFVAPESTMTKLIIDAGLEDKIRKVGAPLYEAKRCIAVRKGNDRLLNLLDQALTGFVVTPEYRRLYVKWYGRPAPYWTSGRILVGSGFLFIVGFCGMALWRYRSIMGLNRDLVNSVGQCKKAEDSLRESNTMLEAMLQASPAAVYVMDRDGIITMWNNASERMFGWSREEAVGKLNPIVPDEKLEEFRSDLEKMLAQGTSIVSKDRRRRRKDGSLIEISISAAPLYNLAGEAYGFVSVIIDISARKQAEDALRESNTMLEALLQASPAAIYVMDRDGIITMWNNASERMFGWSREEAVGKFNPMVPEGKLDEFRSALEKILSGESFVDEERRRLRKDGTPIEISISAAPLSDATGTAYGVISVILDITERKKMEEDLIKAAKLESLGIAAGGIAHDFNNFLTAILGNIGLARTVADEGSKISRWLGEAEKATLKAQGLTNQLLTFSRGGQPVMTLVAIGDLVRETTSFALRGSKWKATVIVPDDLWMVEGDEGQLSQIIHNLVINAAQSMSGGGTVVVRCENLVVDIESRNTPKQGRYVAIVIEDSGSGIPADNLEKIFDPYFTTKQGGNGLGLAICYSIIKKHEGHITVESEPATGTTFHVYLPASDKIMAGNTACPEPMPGGGGRILIMDDDEMVGDVAEGILKNLGYDVEVSLSGTEAIERYKAAMKSGSPFDLVIMDLTVPGGMGGLAAIRRLLKIDPHVRAIVSSGYSDDPVMANYAEYGFKGVVRKPYRVSALASIVGETIKCRL